MDKCASCGRPRYKQKRCPKCGGMVWEKPKPKGPRPSKPPVKIMGINPIPEKAFLPSSILNQQLKEATTLLNFASSYLAQMDINPDPIRNAEWAQQIRDDIAVFLQKVKE